MIAVGGGRRRRDRLGDGLAECESRTNVEGCG